jgi:hypothetical protein
MALSYASYGGNSSPVHSMKMGGKSRKARRAHKSRKAHKKSRKAHRSRREKK